MGCAYIVLYRGTTAYQAYQDMASPGAIHRHWPYQYSILYVRYANTAHAHLQQNKGPTVELLPDEPAVIPDGNGLTNKQKVEILTYYHDAVAGAMTKTNCWVEKRYNRGGTF